MKIDKILVLLGAVLVAIITNYTIFHKESILKSGKSIYLKLVPVDPRSLMQGDYMALRFEVARNIQEALKKYPNSQNLAVLKVDKRGIGKFEAIYFNQPLKADEVLIRFKRAKYRVKLSTDSYFFKEGEAKRYQNAKYGVFKLNPKTGEAILTSLADENLSKL